MGDLADETGVSPAYHAVVDDGAAQTLAKVQVGEVVELLAVDGVAFGSCRPVDVVVDHDRAVDEPGQHVRRGQFTEQERGVGQVDQAAGGPVHRVGGADHREPGLL